MPPKGQELDDHYFGTIRQRIAAYMRQVNEELWKMGVPAKTQHNEVAPAQHELAPIYAEANVAADHNQIMMQTLKRVANQQGLVCLLHEKPFAGVNGSGKHNNWSLTTDDGQNLLDPGRKPHENRQFLLLLACILKAVDTHADLLRESAAHVGNDHRLGAHEAPPAIISVFLGEQLDDVLQQLLRTGNATHSARGGTLHTGVKTLPDVIKDATDRNRTSPFAFTSNKFEFRMVGSRDSISPSTVVINTIVAEALADACDILEQAEDFDTALHDLTIQYIAEHQKIIFGGNGYSEEWVEEAERRGLPNLRSMIDAIPALVTEKSIRMFERFRVFSESELHSRAEIKYESYNKALNIEALTMIDMAVKQIIPAVIGYTGTLSGIIQSMNAIGVKPVVQSELLQDISRLLEEASGAVGILRQLAEEAVSIIDNRTRAHFYHDYVLPAMEALRRPIDRLEMLVDKEVWPMPSYGDLLFEI